MNLSDALQVRESVVAEQSRRKLARFFREFAWPVLQPATEYLHNWHIDAICEHLEAVTRGEIQRLLINVPFRMLKSSVVSQAWPAWEWIDHPSLQYLTASYAGDVATRDAVDSRRIIESDRYQAAFGDRFKMTSDQNVKTRFENDKRGSRVVTSTGAAGTGFGGNRVLIDDPVSALEANSELKRKESVEWFRGTAATRSNNPKEDALVITHQRLHQNDLTGFILAEQAELEWVHLVLPMRYEKKYHCVTKIGFSDPRTTEGELLHPTRLPEETVKNIELLLGSYHTQAQLQQRPGVRGGGVLRAEHFRRYKVLPVIKRVRLFGDTAQKTKEANDYSCFQAWGEGEDGKVYLLDLIRGKWEADDLKRRAIDFWNKHKENYVQFKLPRANCMKVEDKSSGTGLIQQIKKEGGIPIFAIQRNRDKYTRALDFQPYLEAGLICIPEHAPWVSDFVAEVDSFTSDDTHDFDDQIDPMFDAAEDLLSKPKSMWDVI